MNDLPSIKSIINLSGKTAIVTGAALGIGFGIAYRLAEAGASADSLILENHLKTCVVDHIKKGEADASIKEIMSVLEKSR